MSQNIIDVSFDIPKFDEDLAILKTKMLDAYAFLKTQSANLIPIGVGSWTELTKAMNSQAESANKTAQANLIAAKQIAQVEKNNILAAKAAQEAAKATRLQEQAEQARLKTQQQQIDLTNKQAAANAKLANAKPVYDPANVPYVLNVPDNSEPKNTGAVVNDLDKAQAAAAMSATEFGNSVNISTEKVQASIPVIQESVASSKELEAAKLALAKANSTENETIQGYKVQTQAANKAAKDQAATTLGMLSPYQLLNKEYLAAQINAKDLAAQYGVESVEAKEAAASALALNVRLKEIDSSVGQAQRNVGNYASGTANLSKQFHNFTNIASLAGTALSRIRRQFVGFFVTGLVANFIGPAITFITEWVQSLNFASDAMKEIAQEQKALNDVMAEADKNAGKEITDLKLLYEGAEDVKLSTEERIKAAKKLQDTYPDTFKNFTTEQIMLGDAAKGYDALADSILKASIASAARAKIEILAAQELDVMEQKRKITIGTANANLRAQTYSTNTNAGGGGFAMGTGGNAVVVTRDQQIAENNERAQKAYAAQNKIEKNIMDEIKFLTDFAGQQNLEKSVIDSGKKSKTKKGSVTMDSVKNYTDAEFEIYKIDQQRKLKLLDDEVNDEKKSWQVRLFLAADYKNESIKLSDAIYQHDIKNDNAKLKVLEANYKKAKGTEKNNIGVEIFNTKADIQITGAKQNDARLAAEEALNKKEVEIIKQGADAKLKAIKDADKKTEESIENVRKEQQSAIQADYATQLAALDDLLNKKLISQEDYNKKKKKLDQDNKIIDLQSQLQEAKGQKGLAIAKLSEGTGSREDVNIATNKVTQISGQLDSANDINDPKKQLTKEQEAEIKIVQETQNAIASLVDAGYQKQINAIQRIIDLNNERKEKEISAINASTLSNQEKAAEMIILDNTVAANNKKLQREQIEIQIKQAKFDRDAAILQVLENAAVAEFKLAAEEGPFGIAQGIAIGVAAAAQVAALLAKPLPQMPAYAEGTSNHPGGPAIVGEGKFKELVTDPSGKSFITDGPMLINNLPKGSRVKPLTKDFVNEVMYNAMIVGTANAIQAREGNNIEKKLDSISEAIYETSRRSMRKQKNTNVIVNVNAAWHAYIQKNVKE